MIPLLQLKQKSVNIYQICNWCSNLPKSFRHFYGYLFESISKLVCQNITFVSCLLNLLVCKIPFPFFPLLFFFWRNQIFLSCRVPDILNFTNCIPVVFEKQNKTKCVPPSPILPVNWEFNLEAASDSGLFGFVCLLTKLNEWYLNFLLLSH